MKLATSISDFAAHTKNWADAVRQFEGTGFRYLDFNFYNVIYPNSPFLGDQWQKEVIDAKEAAEELGFSFVQAHSPNYNPQGANVDHEAGILATVRSIEACGMLGIPNIVVHTGFSLDYLYPDDKKGYFERNRKFVEQLYPAMEKYNVNVLVENSTQANMGKQYFYMHGQEMYDFAEFCNHPLLHACWDTGHANVEGCDQYREIKDLGKHLKAIHFNDNFGKADQHLCPFVGTMDIDSVIQGLLDIRYEGYCTFESNVLLRSNRWPDYRKKDPSIAEHPCETPSLELYRKAESLLYEVGKHILMTYHCFEE